MREGAAEREALPREGAGAEAPVAMEREMVPFLGEDKGLGRDRVEGALGVSAPAALAENQLLRPFGRAFPLGILVSPLGRLLGEDKGRSAEGSFSTGREEGSETERGASLLPLSPEPPSCPMPGRAEGSSAVGKGVGSEREMDAPPPPFAALSAA